MSRRSYHRRRWIDPQDFIDLRKQAGLKRVEAAEALNVSTRTVQNWETGGARIPWMAYRMLRILRGFALPSLHWEGWKIHADRLYAPTGRWFDANSMQHIEQVFAMSRLWRQEYLSRKHPKPAPNVLPFPDRSLTPAELQRPLQTPLKRKGATR